MDKKLYRALLQHLPVFPKPIVSIIANLAVSELRFMALHRRDINDGECVWEKYFVRFYETKREAYMSSWRVGAIAYVIRNVEKRI